MARQERAVKTRQAILEAAGEVFADRGYAAARISDVYERCGMTKGAFYFHFASKAQLAQAVLDEQVSSQVQYQDVSPDVPDLPGPLDSSGLLTVATQRWVDLGLLVGYRLTFDKMLQGSIRLAVDQGYDALDRKVPYRSWIDVNRDILIEAAAQGELREGVDPDQMARVCVGAFTGVQLMSEVMADRADLEEQAAALYANLARAVSTPEVYAQLDFSVDRGKQLMARAVREERNAV